MTPITTALQRAEQIDKQRQQRRMTAVRELAAAHQHVIDIRTEADQRRAALEDELRTLTDQAQRATTKAWNTATTAGWAEDDLKKAGFTPPTKPRRTSTPKPTKPAPAATTTGDQTNTGPDPEQQ